MKQEIKRLWTTILRSGEYKQGKQALRIGDEYCCLAVLCDLYHKATGKGRWENIGLANEEIRNTDEEYQYRFVSDGYDSSIDLVPEVQEWAGIDQLGSLPENKYMRKDAGSIYAGSLVGLNDSGYSFDEIAGIIEEEL